MTPYPWHTSLWRRICADVDHDRVPHALLLGGRAGFGKRRFASALASYLLCSDRRDTAACGECRSCLLFLAGSHPDYQLVTPPDDGKQITVDGIRDCLDFTSLSSGISRHKVVLMVPSEAMNRNAANALLKTLEEPTAGTIFLLVSDQPSALLATIRSRCRRIALDQIDFTEAVTWVSSRLPEPGQAELACALAGGAPVVAAELDLPSAMAELSAIISLLNAVAANERDALLAIVEYANEHLGTSDVLVRLIETMIYKSRAIDAPFDAASHTQRRSDAVTSKLDIRSLLGIRELLMQQRRNAFAWSGLRERDRIEELFLTVSHLENRGMQA